MRVCRCASVASGLSVVPMCRPCLCGEGGSVGRMHFLCQWSAVYSWTHFRKPSPFVSGNGSSPEIVFSVRFLGFAMGLQQDRRRVFVPGSSSRRVPERVVRRLLPGLPRDARPSTYVCRPSVSFPGNRLSIDLCLSTVRFVSWKSISRTIFVVRPFRFLEIVSQSSYICRRSCSFPGNRLSNSRTICRPSCSFPGNRLSLELYLSSFLFVSWKSSLELELQK